MVLTLWYQLFKSRGVVKANLSVTNLCNYRCLHCNIWKTYVLNPALRSLEITSREFLQVLENTPTLRWVSITGGEPFLKSDIEELLLNLPENIKLVSINTNGSYPEKILKILKMAVSEFSGTKFYISISLDGPPEVHNKIRGINTAFDNAVKTFLLLHDLSKKTSNLTVNFEYTVNPWNIGKFSELMEYFRRHNLKINAENFVISLYEISEYYNNKLNEEKTYREQIVAEIQQILKNFPRITLKPSVLFAKAYLSLASEYYTKKKAP